MYSSGNCMSDKNNRLHGFSVYEQIFLIRKKNLLTWQNTGLMQASHRFVHKNFYESF